MTSLRKHMKVYALACAILLTLNNVRGDCSNVGSIEVEIDCKEGPAEEYGHEAITQTPHVEEEFIEDKLTSKPHVRVTLKPVDQEVPEKVEQELETPTQESVVEATKLTPFTLPVTLKCAQDESVVFILHQAMALAEGVEGKTLSGATIEECNYMCKHNQDGAGEAIACSGFEYDATAKKCRLLTGTEFKSLTDSRGPQLYQKGCVRSSQVCDSPFAYEMLAQHVLVGYAKQVVSSASVQDCWKSCLESVQNFGFQCQSAMFYPDDQDCILNTETKYQRPDLFVEESKDAVVYFDNNCAGATCSGDSVLQYTKSENVKIEQGVVLVGYSFQACEYLCTHRIGKAGVYNCKAFAYEASSETCTLIDDRLQPMGRAKPVDAQGVDYYEKQCYTAKAVCRQVPSFLRYPQQLLVGYAAFVIENVPSVTKCQDLCLGPPAEAGSDFKCMSLMYYYEEQDCILNSEMKKNKPDLFVRESEGFKVDYFDITCLTAEDDHCTEGYSITSIRVAGHQLPITVNNTLKASSGSASRCLKECRENFPEKCRSINYENDASKCHLMFTSSLSAPLTSSRPSEYFELACVPGTISDCVYAFDRMMNTESSSDVLRMLQVPSAMPDCLGECLSEEACQGVNYNHEDGACQLLQGGGSTKESATVSFYSKVCGAAEGVQTICNFDGMKVKVTKDVPFTGAIFVKMKYDTCRVEVKDSNAAMLHLGFPLSSMEQKVPEVCPGGACEQKLRDKRQAYVGAPSPPQPPASSYSQVKPAAAVQGAYSTGAKVPSKAPHRLLPPPTMPVRDCGLVEFNNGTYKAVVVVQTNNLGIPGLVTSSDEIYEVTCDYSSVQAKKIETEAQLHVEGPKAAHIHPRGKVELSSPVVMNMAGNGQSVLQAKLGEILQLKWEMMVQDSTLDFFVKQCVAERGDSPKSPYAKKEDGTNELVDASQSSGAYGTYGSSACPKPPCKKTCTPELCPVERTPIASTLKLIENGCPTPSVANKLMPGLVKAINNSTKVAPLQAFRFDGSRTVRIICQLEICQGPCKPAMCNSGGKDQPSYGRKKRDNANSGIPSNFVYNKDNGKIYTDRYVVPKRSSALTTFVIVDPQDEELLKQSARQVDVQTVDSADVFDVAAHRENKGVNVCFPKSTFASVSSFLGMCAIAQCLAIGVTIARRFKKTSAY